MGQGTRHLVEGTLHPLVRIFISAVWLFHFPLDPASVWLSHICVFSRPAAFIYRSERQRSVDAPLVARTQQRIVLLFGFCSSSWGGGTVVKLR